LKPAPFDYFAPASVEEALALLREHAPEGKLLAGGQSLVPLLNLRLAKPRFLIDLNGIAELARIDATAESLVIGATVRQSALEHSAVARENCPLLCEAVRHIGHVAIRHRGTVGGSLMHADPAAELPAVALALDAKFRVARHGADREIPASDFFLDYLTTAVEPDEMLREIVFPFVRPAAGFALEEITRRHGDFAVAGAVAIVELDAHGRIVKARIVLFGIGATPLRAEAVEQALIGRSPELDSLRAAAALLPGILDPPDDVRASSAYRKHAAAIVGERALARAVARCRRGEAA
jgi:carbon-monoxide dehydrogenase medium subunit